MNFQELLAERGTLVADGAMGTILFDLGLETGGCPELLNVEQPDLVQKVHQGYYEAGSDIVLTNTFGGTAARLKLHKMQDRVAELNTAAVEIARRAGATFDRPTLVAGSIGPTGELFEPLGPLTRDEGIALFSEQCDALVEAGVDILWIETLSSWEELDAAVTAASGRGVPVTATLSFDTNGHTMMGLAPKDFGTWWHDHQIAGLGANCGIGPSDVVQAAGEVHSTAPDAIVIAKGNCGIPLYKDEQLVYPTGPEAMADYAELAVRSGASIVGACCGSGFEHIAAIRAAVDAGINGERPTSTEVSDRLGKVSAPIEKPQRTRRRSH
jgi:methionine synthase I (cobalamin-dependent)